MNSWRLFAEVPIVLISRKDLPVNNLQEFIAYAKANQTKMQYGSAGAGSATHLGCVLLNYLIGVDITHVPQPTILDDPGQYLRARARVNVNLELSRSGNGVRNGFRRPDGRGSGQFAESALDTLYVARNRG